MNPLVPPSFCLKLDHNSKGTGHLEVVPKQSLEYLKRTLSVLLDSVDRLQRIQEQYESLLAETDVALALRPASKAQISEMVVNAGCTELNDECVHAIERLTASLKRRTATLWKAQLQ